MPNVVSIYAGGGGIDCGFYNAGYDLCLSTDNWRVACDTLEKNGHSKLVKCADIRDVDYEACLNEIGSVSYTHLDVYKRQHHAGRGEAR